MPIHRPIPALFILLALAFPPKSTAASQFTISGTGYAAPLGTHPITTVNAYDKTTMTLLGTTSTLSDGSYTVNFYPVGIDNHKQAGLSGVILRNPYQERLEISVSAKEAGAYSLSVSDINGSILLSNSVSLQSGSNTLTISGLGAAGMKTIQLSGNGQKLTFKAIQSASGALSPSIEVHHTNVPLLKSVPLTDSLLVSFVPPTGYIGMDTNISFQSQTVNYVLQQNPVAVSFTLKPFLETGESVTLLNPTFTITIEWNDSTIVYPVVSGQINISRNYYPLNPPDLGTVWIYNDTSTHIINGVPNGVLNWCIIRQPKQVTNRPNVAQNETTAGALIPDYKTEVSLDSLNGKILHYYTVRKYAQIGNGTYTQMDSEFSKGLIESSGDGGWSGMFIDLKPFGVADSLDIVMKGFNESTGNPMPQSDLDRAMNLFMLALQTRYLPNGDTLMPPHRIYTITTNNDPRWQVVIARGGANSIQTIYYNGTPENQRAFATTYTYNSKPRINYTAAKYAIANNDAQIYTENFSAVTGEEEGSGGLSPWVWNGITNVPTQYAKSISTVPVLLNLGTGQ